MSKTDFKMTFPVNIKLHVTRGCARACCVKASVPGRLTFHQGSVNYFSLLSLHYQTYQYTSTGGLTLHVVKRLALFMIMHSLCYNYSKSWEGSTISLAD